MKRKHQDEFEHFRQRMLERYNMEIDLDDFVKINQMIHGVDSILLYEEDNDQHIRELTFRGIQIQVVYSNFRKKITTALPSGSWKR